MGCKECKETNFSKQAIEVTTSVTDYLKHFARAVPDSHFQEITIKEDILKDAINESDTTVVKTKKNDIKHIGKEELFQSSIKISDSARTKKTFGDNYKRTIKSSVISLDANKLCKAISRQLFIDETKTY